MKLPRVVIVGAGFGGIAAVKALTRAPVEVTIVDQHNFHTFSPLLYQVATAGLASEDIAPNLRGIVQRARNVEARMATVRGVEFDRHEVLVDHGVSIPYDYLILAAGAVSSDFGVPGVAEHAIPLKTLADATRVRSTVLRRFEEANTDPSLVEGGTLTFVVPGGGPTGVEFCGALGELFTKVLAKDFKNLDVGRAQVILVEMTDRLLGGFSAESQAEAKLELELRGVDVRLRVPIASVGPDKVELADGTVIPARSTVWTAGVKANPLADALGLAQTTRGEILVGADLTVPAHPDVFVIGDLAAVQRPGSKPYPQLAPVAMPGATRGPHDRAADARQANEAVPLHRQGDHGHDRMTLRGRGVTVRHPVRRDTRLGELARSAPGIPDRVPQSGRRPRELGMELRQVGPRQPSNPLRPRMTGRPLAQ